MSKNNKTYKSSEVNIGGVYMGGHYPVRIQSMTNTNTMNFEGTVRQCIALIESGCEYVRITVPGMKEAENLLKIKNRLRQDGYITPLIADVHYLPDIAEYCARFIEKVRINPGNYTEKRRLNTKQFSEEEFSAGFEKMASRLRPLLKICKEYGTAIRIGTNHGSLSDRILDRFGNTSLGMAEATMEFLQILKAENFSNAVVSIKASNPLLMINANQLLVEKMISENLLFPVHLGVTEAGQGEDGRIKSALGIGTLLQKGIGDTIRVSLTEDPVNEIPFAKKLVENYPRGTYLNVTEKEQVFIEKIELSPLVEKWKRALCYPALAVLLAKESKNFEFSEDTFADFVCLPYENILSKNHTDYRKSNVSTAIIIKADAFIKTPHISTSNQIFIECNKNDCENSFLIGLLKEKDDVGLVLSNNNPKELLKDISRFREQGVQTPVFIKCIFDAEEQDIWLIKKTVFLGHLILENSIDGVLCQTEGKDLAFVSSCILGIFQAARKRISKTDFIACPSCGRTSYNIEDTLKKIKAATGHLKGLKIGVMGCVVNGPGEMADADYGYVGNAAGRINLYRGKNPVEKNIDETDAIDKLITLIKADGLWVEKPH
ncbi:MAG: (E)-4-hydroxy-3-methylbut-2-enyl-diphosphate synthase [Bacteroidales bacterium]|nr:(E)-4-hydroxy-3-methylbut-2-enyl-diphosphate synthase [Bacteroidales bacterium]